MKGKWQAKIEVNLAMIKAKSQKPEDVPTLDF
jgi:hypothetical protein